MQPLMRHASRPLFTPSSSAILRNARPLSRASICLQCRYQTAQRRAYTDNNNNNNNRSPFNNDNDLPFIEIPAHLRPKAPPPPKLEQEKPPAPKEPEKPQAPEAPDAPEPTASEIDRPRALPSSAEGRRSHAAKRFSHIMDHLQSNIFVASQRINDLTGYSGIESLKNDIIGLEQQVSESQEAVRLARLAYKTTVADRASTQREVTTLLARKDSWSPSDLERFTSLYRSDHSNEQAVQESATKLADAEREAERAASKLSSSILARYHEEQIWSDKIRRMSTWGTWGLMGVNVLLFLVFQFGFEPWRRKRLVAGFEEKVREALVREKIAHAGLSGERGEAATAEAEAALDGIVASGLQELEDNSANTVSAEEVPPPEDPAVEAVAAVISEDVDTATSIPPEELLEVREKADIRRETFLPATNIDWRDPATWKQYMLELFSERSVSLRQADLTIIALEGVVSGAAFVGLIAALVLRRN